jgi:hypothetical protein
MALSDKNGVTRIEGTRFPLWTLMIATMLTVPCAAARAYGQASASEAARQDVSQSERQEKVLRWLDNYLTDSVLMREEDMAKIREAVAQMTPSQLDQWLKQTQTLRDFVASSQWQATKRWLREFLRVQAIYSDAEIEQLRDEVFAADAEQMLAILQRIQAKHESMVWMHGVSEHNRQRDLQQRDAAMQRQAAASRSARSSTARSVPLFGQSGVSSGSRSSSGYRPPPPLITSRDMARATVWRELGFGW